MTHSGGKPHNVGDKGQRYEISYLDFATGERKVFGWSNDIQGADAMCASIEAHPSMLAAQIRDRQEDAGR